VSRPDHTAGFGIIAFGSAASLALGQKYAAQTIGGGPGGIRLSRLGLGAGPSLSFGSKFGTARGLYWHARMPIALRRGTGLPENCAELSSFA
jgi:hypothetical protein